MPYIAPEQRVRLQALGDLPKPENAGELNYVLTRIALEYLQRHGRCYQNFNDILGAMEGAKLELYRRHVAPYEDRKIKDNGDVT